MKQNFKHTYFVLVVATVSKQTFGGGLEYKCVVTRFKISINLNDLVNNKPQCLYEPNVVLLRCYLKQV